MYNSNLIAKFQLNISIFEGLAIYQTLLQSLKQNTNRSAHSGRIFSSSTRVKSFLGDNYHIIQNDYRNFQTPIFKSNEAAGFQNLLQSLKQNEHPSARSGRMMLRL